MSNGKSCLDADLHSPHVWRSAATTDGLTFYACPGVTDFATIAATDSGIKDPAAPNPAALSDDFAYIRYTLVPEWLMSFEQKSREYGQMHRELGTRAQYVDINRKTAKLRRALWDGVDTSSWREQPREIAEDLIGHLFLLLAMMDRMDELEGAG